MKWMTAGATRARGKTENYSLSRHPAVTQVTRGIMAGRIAGARLIVSGAPGISTIPDAGPGLVTVLPDGNTPTCAGENRTTAAGKQLGAPTGVGEYLNLASELTISHRLARWERSLSRLLPGIQLRRAHIRAERKFIFAERIGTSVTPARAAFFSVI